MLINDPMNPTTHKPIVRIGDRVIILGTKGRQEDIRIVKDVQKDGCIVEPPLDGKSFFYFMQLVQVSKDVAG